MDVLLHDLKTLPKGIAKFSKCINHLRKGTFDSAEPSIIRWWDWFTDCLRAWAFTISIGVVITMLVMGAFNGGSQTWTPDFDRWEHQRDIENGVYLVNHRATTPAPVIITPEPVKAVDEQGYALPTYDLQLITDSTFDF